MMTPRFGSSCFWTYAAMAPATRRTLSKVKSSAITPRHPSVPNLISVIPVLYRLGQLCPLLLVEMFHNFSDILGAIECSNQQCVIGLNHDQVVDANDGNELSA